MSWNLFQNSYKKQSDELIVLWQKWRNKDITSQERFNTVKEILEENNLSLCTLNINQFDKLSDLELIVGAKETIESDKIKYYWKSYEMCKIKS